MLYIEKGAAPTSVTQEIARVGRENNLSRISKYDRDAARIAFDQLNKDLIRKQLYKEQKSLCAYCMRKLVIDDKSAFEAATIEHWTPISADATKALDYRNMMLCSDGGRRSTKLPHILCCDAAKGDKTITISPYRQEQMKRIRYRRDGDIFVDPEDKLLSHDINYVLKLNGDLDENGRRISDTSSGLVRARKQVYEEFEIFIKGLVRVKKPIGSAIRKRIHEISQKEEYNEFAGVWLYFLRRKLWGPM